MKNVAKAIASFERTLVSRDSAFDRYEAGDTGALEPAEGRGRSVLRAREVRYLSRRPDLVARQHQSADTGLPVLAADDECSHLEEVIAIGWRLRRRVREPASCAVVAGVFCCADVTAVDTPRRAPRHHTNIRTRACTIHSLLQHVSFFYRSNSNQSNTKRFIRSIQVDFGTRESTDLRLRYAVSPTRHAHAGRP